MHGVYDEVGQNRVCRRGRDTDERRTESAAQNWQPRFHRLDAVSSRVTRRPREENAKVRTGRFHAHDEAIWAKRVLLKGSYLYEYMIDVTKLDEIALPPKCAFYSRLYDEHISDEEYERAQKIWEDFSMNTLRDWHHWHKEFRRYSG